MTCKVRDLGSPAESVSYEDASWRPARLHAPVGLTLDAAGIGPVGGTAEIAQASPEITATGSSTDTELGSDAFGDRLSVGTVETSAIPRWVCFLVW